MSSIFDNLKKQNAEKCRIRAEQGDVDAQHTLGLFYQKGTGVPQDYSEARKWYYKAAAQGNAVSQLYLGALVAEGHDANPDYIEGYKWLDLAASAKSGKDLTIRPLAISNRNRLAKLMTTSQIAEAERLSSEFRKGEPVCSPVNIYHVDDEDCFLEMVGQAIRAKFKNVIVQEFQDVEQVWKQLLRADPDILITDDKMPDLTGEDLVRRLVENGAPPPIIVTSGWPPTEQWVREYADKNVNIALLRSPYTSEQLYKELCRQLGTKLACRSKEEEELIRQTQRQSSRLPRLTQKPETKVQGLALMHEDALKFNLKKKYNSVEEVEAEHMVTDPRLGIAPMPFGFNNNEWRELLAQMQDGDELWTFSTSDESWDNMAGRAGVSLVRRGKIIDSIVTMMN